jgi:hypothetical protein
MTLFKTGVFFAVNFIKNRRKKVSNVRPVTGHEQGEQKYSSTLSLTSALELGGRLTSRPGLFTPEEEIRYPVQEAKCAENLAPTEIRSPDHPARSESLYLLSYSGRLTIGLLL